VEQCQRCWLRQGINNGLVTCTLYLFCIFASFFSFLSLFVFLYKKEAEKKNHSGLYIREEGSEYIEPSRFGTHSFPLGLLTGLKLGSSNPKGFYFQTLLPYQEPTPKPGYIHSRYPME
jgi:hypothetical protein